MENYLKGETNINKWLVKIYIYTETYGIGFTNSLSVWEGLRRPLVARQVVNTTRQEPEIHS